MSFRVRSMMMIAALIPLCIVCVSCSDSGTGPAGDVPTLTTNTISTITRSSAESGGNVTSDGGSSITAWGVCWNTSANPTVSNSKTSETVGVGGFVSKMAGLAKNTTYFVRAYATNGNGTGYGDEETFTTLDSAYTVVDFDGNSYKALSIGTQVWMIENLRVGHYRNGDVISMVADNAAWVNLTDGARCHYSNYLPYSPIYGSLYNWFAAVDPRGLAPAGWHIPSSTEWATLKDYIIDAYGVDESEVGGLMKEAGYSHWDSPNLGATNETGFTALGSGSRHWELGIFGGMKTVTGYWSATEVGTGAYVFVLRNTDSTLVRLWNEKEEGLSVRCVMGP